MDPELGRLLESLLASSERRAEGDATANP